MLNIRQEGSLIIIEINKALVPRMVLLAIAVLTITSLVFALDAFVHEAGHIIGCTADSLISPSKGGCSIGGWQNVSYAAGLNVQVPNKTVGPGQLLYFFGGPVTSIIFFFLLTRLQFFREYQVQSKIGLAGIAVFEVGRNMVCGTDNWTGAALFQCSSSVNNLFFVLGFLLVYACIWGILYDKSEKPKMGEKPEMVYRLRSILKPKDKPANSN